MHHIQATPAGTQWRTGLRTVEVILLFVSVKVINSSGIQSKLEFGTYML
jgi:hypothetical protein